MKAKRFLSLLLAGLMLTACGTTDDPSNESAPMPTASPPKKKQVCATISPTI